MNTNSSPNTMISKSYYKNQQTGSFIKCPKLSPLYIPLIPSACRVQRLSKTPATNKTVDRIQATSSENNTN